MTVHIISNPDVRIAPMCQCCELLELAGFYQHHHEKALHHCTTCDEECSIIECDERCEHLAA